MVLTRSRIGQKLAEVVGRDAVLSDEDARRWRIRGVNPTAVVRPRTAEAIAAVLALASAEGWHVEPAGSATCLDWGRQPERVDILLSTAALSEIHEYEPGDMVVGTEGGATLAGVQARLATERQWLPWDPPSATRATIGAVVAHAAAGALRLGYGTPRDHVLGLRLVTGDGRLLSVGGRVVKNVAGYDVGKLIVGSRGTLAIVVGAYLRLRALPETDSTLRVVSADHSPLVELAGALAASALPAVALELLSPPLSRDAGVGEGWTLLARYHGSTEATHAAIAAARNLAISMTGVTVLESPDAGAWSRLAALESESSLAVRVADRPNALAGTLSVAETLGAALGPELTRIAAHAGDGIVRVLSGGAHPGVAEAIRIARDRMSERGGSVNVARVPAGTIVEPFGDVGPAGRLMRGLKAVFDPAGVLSPGRFA